MENVGKKEKDTFLFNLIKERDYSLIKSYIAVGFKNKSIFSSAYVMKSSDNSSLCNMEATRRNGLSRKQGTGAESIYDKEFQNITISFRQDELLSEPEFPFPITPNLSLWLDKCNSIGIVSECKDPELRKIFDGIRNSNYLIRDYVFPSRNIIIENDGFQHQVDISQFLKDIVSDTFIYDLYHLVTIRLITLGHKVNRCIAKKRDKGYSYEVDYITKYNEQSQDIYDTRITEKINTYLLSLREELYDEENIFITKYLYDNILLYYNILEIKFEEFRYVRWIINEKFDTIFNDECTGINISFSELEKVFPDLETNKILLFKKIKDRFKKITEKNLCILF